MKETIEKVVMVIVIIIVIFVARLYFDQKANEANEEKSRIESLEHSALRADSLEIIIDVYNIENPHLDVELDADKSLQIFEAKFINRQSGKAYNNGCSWG